MLFIHDRPGRFCSGWSRREVLRVGGLSLMGLGLPSLLAARDSLPPGVLPTDKTFGKAKNVIYLFLAGGPPQHETFDPKPDAPAEIRGAFHPISTNVPGIQFCELLPRTARIADKLAIIRSLATDDNNHDSSGHWVLTGYKYQGPNSRTIQPTDWPYFGSIVKKVKPSETIPPLTSVWIPDWMRLNENVTPAGQTGGLMGPQWDPDRFVGDPADPRYKVEGFQLTGLPPLRLKQRQSLLRQVEEQFAAAQRGEAVKLYDGYQQQAFELLTSSKAREAFAIEQEPATIRDKYGRHSWGQSVLLARRLVEAGVRLVHVQWPREPGDNAVDNPLWDTHAQNADRLEDVLCPQFDVTFSTLIEDLDQRGLLDDTLVVAIGEFGRTPNINGNGGRDHWGAVFSCALAGAGIAGGQVYGASDKQGAYPAQDRVDPGHLTATIFHLLGINYSGSFHDREGREHRLSLREPLYKLLGIDVATRDRTTCTGDVARVPPFDPTRHLMESDFQTGRPLDGFDGPSRPKRWRATPQATGEDGIRFGVQKIPAGGPAPPETAFVLLGLLANASSSAQSLDKGASAILTQEVRSPFAGTYHFHIRARLRASSPALAEAIFAKHLTCRLLFFQYTDKAKSPGQRKELASLVIAPKLDESEKFTVSKEFVNPNPGQNFSFGLGMGVAIIVEKTSDGSLPLAAEGDQFAALCLESVQLDFNGKPRNEDVRV